MMEDCPCKGPGAETFLLGSNGEKKQTNDALKVEVLREGSKFHHSAERTVIVEPGQPAPQGVRDDVCV